MNKEEIEQLKEEIEKLKERKEDIESNEATATEEYNNMLDESPNWELVSFSKALEECDPIAYRCGYNDYFDEELSNIENEITEKEEEIKELEEEEE